MSNLNECLHPTNWKCSLRTVRMSAVEKSTKTIVKVREKAIDIKMFSQTIINKRLKDLINNSKTDGTYLSPSF